MPGAETKLAEALVVADVPSLIFAVYFLAYIAWTAPGLPTDLYLNPWLAALGVLGNLWGRLPLSLKCCLLLILCFL